MSVEPLEPERAKSRELNSLRPALRFLRPYTKQILIASLALIITASVTLSIGQGMRVVIDSGFGASADSGLLRASLGLFGVLIVALTVGTFVRFYYVSWVGERVSADIRNAVYEHLIDLHPGFFEENQPTEIQSRITTDTTLLQTVIGSSVSIALRNILMFVGGVALLLFTNPKLTLIVLGCIPLVILPIMLFGRRVRSLSRSSQDTLADVGSYAGESLRNIKVVQAYNHQQADVSAFDRRVESAFKVAVRRIRQRAFLIAVVMLLVFGAIAAMVWVGGQDVISGRTSAGELAAFVFYAFIVAGSVAAISEVLTDLQRAAGAMERLMELLVAPNELLDPASQSSSTPVTNHPVAGGLEFDAVSFSYATRRDAQVLNDLSFKIAPGSMVALVGPSGAGKTTVFELMMRFYDPTAGRVLLDGCDLTELPRAHVRTHIGLVPQDATLLAGSIRSLVAYRDGTAQPDAARVQWALEKANALDFVERLPEGLDTQLGEGGIGLSGGQRQRLAIARALYSGPKVLLLDEATSALDAESEGKIRDAISSLKGECTLVVIAHRLSTVTGADRILVLDDGCVVASGTHDELLTSSPLYARYAEVQLAGSNNDSWRSTAG